MLTSLNVRDFAIVEAVETSLGRGLTVVSGETGAGKSLLVDALLLLSGARADSAMVRAGRERAELSARFDLGALPQVRAWLVERDLDDEDECLLRRVVRSESASRAWINGRPVPAQTLAELAAQLVEIHGQHEHQALLDRGSQLRLLDRHGDHYALLAELEDLAGRWHELDRQRSSLTRRTGDDGARLDLLRHDLGELQRHALEPDALKTVEQDHHRLAHQGATLEACAEAAALLDGDQDGSILTSMARARHCLDRALAGDPALGAIAELLTTSELELREAALQLAGYLDDADSDPQRLHQLDRQLARLHELGRKHRCAPEHLAARRDEIAAELSELESADARLQALQAQLGEIATAWQRVATELSARRRDTAERLSLEISALMAELGMAGGRFVAELETTNEGPPDRLGRERVEFLVSANPGQPPRPLRKIASGGELSRIALAIEVAALGEDPVSTMVFDEVDSGVGGAVAEILGRKLRRLGEHVQVLCVTHLPQVAAQGHRHLSVTKQAVDGQTRTDVVALDGERRVAEIARMLGGVEITQTTLAHARQMLADVKGADEARTTTATSKPERRKRTETRNSA